jgi:hypothetical protein
MRPSTPTPPRQVPSFTADLPEQAAVGADTLALWQAVEEAGLGRYIGELDVKGYTIIPPDVAGTDRLCPKLLDAVMDVAVARLGKRPQLDAGGENSHSSLGSLFSYLLFEDAAFQELLLLPAVSVLLTYMVGSHALLSSMQAQLKAAGQEDLPLHCDNVLFSAPFPAHYPFCNISINLTDYLPDSGPICFVPGSHKLYRHPGPGEGDDQRVAGVAPRGSLIVFTGNTWHGAFARRAPGLRASILMQFVRPQIRTFEPYREDAPQELIDRHGPRFARLMGRHINHGWRIEGPANEGSAYSMGRHAYD